MSTERPTQTAATRPGSPLADRKALVLSAILLAIGFIARVIASQFHPSGVDPNNHPAVFLTYARSTAWTADHLGGFVAEAITIAGLLILFYALNLQGGIPGLVARIGIASAGVALALTAVQFAADGVVLKRAVDAWVSAPDAEKAARFASAETVRWLEEATGSYQALVLGFTLILLAALVGWTARISRPIGYALALSGVVALGGVGYIARGWILGAAGFAPEGDTPTRITQYSQPIWSVLLFIVAWRMRPAQEARHG